VVEYDEKVAEFSALANEISGIIQRREDIQPDEQIASSVDPGRNERIIRELNTETAHSLDEDFSYKRPYGFVLDGQAFTGTVNWRQLYHTLCRHLAQRDLALFATVPGDQHFVGARGKWAISRNPKHMIVPLLIADGIYAEGNMSANAFRDTIVRLLDKFGIRSQSLRLYLRQDRDAGRQPVEWQRAGRRDIMQIRLYPHIVEDSDILGANRSSKAHR
ncbi:MAG: hypothetical protein ACRDHE_06540, partial [Ktedonobacterales bacterium]